MQVLMIVLLSVSGSTVLGFLLGLLIRRIPHRLNDGVLGFAAGGAMLYVIGNEMIPETHAHGFEKQATFALLAGVMTVLLFPRFLTALLGT